MRHRPLSALFIYGETYRVLRNHINCIEELLECPLNKIEEWLNNEQIMQLLEALERHGLYLQDQKKPEEPNESSTIELLQISDIEIEYPVQNPISALKVTTQNGVFEDPRGSVVFDEARASTET